MTSTSEPVTFFRKPVGPHRLALPVW